MPEQTSHKYDAATDQIQQMPDVCGNVLLVLAPYYFGLSS